MPHQPRRILIVDDDQEVLIALERTLEGEGYNTVTAWSAKEALALSENSQFDLLLVDEHMSDLDVEALFSELTRKQPKAFRFLMQTRKEAPQLPSFTDIAVCKWEHGAMKAAIRDCLSA